MKGAFVILGIFAAYAAFVIYRESKQVPDATAKALDLLAKARNRPAKGADPPYVRPKILVLVNDSRSIPEINPTDWRAVFGKNLANDAGDEVRTLVLVTCGNVNAGTYVNIEDRDKAAPKPRTYVAQRHSCDVDIMDISDPTVTIKMQRTTLVGPDPPQETAATKDQGGSALPKVKQYVAGLLKE